MSARSPKFVAGQLNTYTAPADVSDVTRALRLTGRRVMLVPTMGALHEGHLTLVRTAKRVPGSVVVVSIFVNPLQFGPNEDLDAYPRTLEADAELLRAEGVEIVFAPTAAAMYPDGPRTSVHPGPLGADLEGASRPTHFAGMLTVVLKLLQIVRPDRAFFGEKDYQQLILVRQMVADLNVDVRIVGVPIVREDDGLAMSSRNRYLDADQREQAGALSAALLAARYARGHGRRRGPRRGARGTRRGARDRGRLPRSARAGSGARPGTGTRAGPHRGAGGRHQAAGQHRRRSGAGRLGRRRLRRVR